MTGGHIWRADTRPDERADRTVDRRTDLGRRGQPWQAENSADNLTKSVTILVTVD